MQKITKLIKRLVEFPNATICRHEVAIDLAVILQDEYGIDASELTKALFEGSNGDEDALEALEALRGVK